MILGAHGQPLQPGGPRLATPGNPFPDAPPENPIAVHVDPQSGSIAVVDTRTGVQAVFSSRGTFGIRDAHNNFIQSTEDGTLEFVAKRVRFVCEENPQVVILKKESEGQTPQED